jgi:hypothetical protein
MVAMVFSLVIGSTLAWAGCPDDDDFTTEFRLEDCMFDNDDKKGANPYFSLEPGYQLVLEGEEDDEEIFVVITVTEDTEWVGKVKTRVVEESEWVDGQLVEVSLNYFARCEETNAVYYFGELVDNYEDGVLVDHEGSWRAVGNNKPGLIMPGTFLLGSRYFQEWAPKVALDRGQNVAMGLNVKTPAGNFKNCVEVLDTDPLDGACGEIDPDTGEIDGDIKVYCPGVGLVMDEELELVEYGDYIFDLE